ncbi:hypothetical protein SAMN02910436_00479 [Ruminococcaceae bacterium P7]|nr:hypothetical protein SAMN02910436_00479 [Ruminococcaceae bacterium P7]
MLHLKIQETIQLMEAVEDNRKTANNHKAIAQKNTIFFNSINVFSKNVESYFVAREVGFDLTEDEEITQNMKDIIGCIKTAFAIQAANDARSFEEKVQKFNRSISNCWISFFHRKYDELLRGLVIAKTIHSTPMIVEKIISSIKKCEKWPLTSKNADALRDGEEKGLLLLREMELDEDIKVFLEKVSASTATIRDVTPEIFQWIIKEKLDDKIALTMKE